MARPLLFSATVWLFGVYITPTYADLALFEHNGNADPTTEGWSIGGTNGAAGSVHVSVGPLTNDAGSGLDAWFVNDTSSVGGSNQSYFQTLSTQQSNQASSLGWSLKTTIRIPNASETAGLSPFLTYRDGAIGWDMVFGSEADGDPFIVLRDTFLPITGSTYTVQGVGSSYVTYELVYDPVAGSADLFVDGIERLSNHVGFATSDGPGVGWGSGSSLDTGQGNYNNVEFSITAIPEPSAFLVVGTVFCFLLGRRYSSHLEVA